MFGNVILLRYFFIQLGMKKLTENNISKAVNHIFESLRLYSLILNQKNSNIAKCEDGLAKCFAIAGKTLVMNVNFSCILINIYYLIFH